jgi:hypothetical protein
MLWPCYGHAMAMLRLPMQAAHAHRPKHRGAGAGAGVQVGCGVWGRTYVCTVPGWQTLTQMRDPRAVSRRCSSAVNMALAALLWMYLCMVGCRRPDKPQIS